MSDREAVITLRTELANDVLALARVLEKLPVTPDELRRLPARDARVAAAAFELHNYYCVSENLMRRVATAFENALDPTQWRRQLLARMALDITGVRPALVDPALRSQLDELRKFRHFFRNAYDRELEPRKVADVLAILLAWHEAWLGAVRRFQDWLGELAKRLEP